MLPLLTVTSSCGVVTSVDVNLGLITLLTELSTMSRDKSNRTSSWVGTSNQNFSGEAGRTESTTKRDTNDDIPTLIRLDIHQETPIVAIPGGFQRHLKSKISKEDSDLSKCTEYTTQYIKDHCKYADAATRVVAGTHIIVKAICQDAGRVAPAGPSGSCGSGRPDEVIDALRNQSPTEPFAQQRVYGSDHIVWTRPKLQVTDVRKTERLPWLPRAVQDENQDLLFSHEDEEMEVARRN
jgi:hypothetical protein